MIKQLNIKDSYDWYANENKMPVDYKVYKHIIENFMKFIFRKIIEGFTVQLSSKDTFGALAVEGKRVKLYIDPDTGKLRGGIVDWVKTKEMWERRPETKIAKDLVFFTNDHTNNITYRIIWKKGDMKLTNKGFYGFYLSRANKRAASKVFKSGKDFYVREY